jgi:DNA-binding transcriptional MerR regulator
VDAVETVDPANDAAARQALLASDKLYYRIGEVSRLTGVKAHVLRYWETEFRWMAPPKSRSKQRLYRKRDIEFVWLLKRLLWEERYTIAGARQRIRELGVEEALSLLDGPSRANPVDPASTGHEQERSGELPELSVLRLSLEEIQQDLLALREVLQEGA